MHGGEVHVSKVKVVTGGGQIELVAEYVRKFVVEPG